MDQILRNKLRNVVTQCRKLLEEAVSQVLQGQFGIYASGRKDEVHVEDESRMKNLSDEDRGYRRDIQAHLGHIQALGYSGKDALAQLVREIAFTHLNRLCAYKMMEAREVWIGGQRFREAVSRGMKSQGFQFYLADHTDDKKLFDTGHQDVAYRHFLNWLGALLSEEIGVLFSPTDPANRLFPPQRVLDDVLTLLNSDELSDIWTEDETIGWVYQYFTPKELRDQVRKESAAPRNSYELAFRNQFFTPRFVVEFLTDNTLGRIWYEMRKGDTKLKDQCRYIVRRPSEVFLAEGESPPEPPANQDELSQEQLLKQPVYILHRSKKDPRELRILDPACGSGHFLLYCFLLLLTIYEEAYADSDLGPKLKDDYPTLEALRRDMPRLILAHNLHGVDIDLRCSQIAALALWLRCQRAYGEMGLKQDRPRITKSNIVCAEPMPGENEMLKEFVTQLQPKLLGHLVEIVFDKMKLAGEAGSLLKIEEELQEAIADARKQWVAEHEQAKDRKGRPLLFSRAEMERLASKTPQQHLDFSDITNEQFWNEAESQVLSALRSYAAHASNGGTLQRQLFAGDAAHGFAFIDVCQKRFDVVLMNPPFGSGTARTRAYIDRAYTASKNDLYCTFVESSLDRLTYQGVLGCITSRMGFFLPAMQMWRERVLLSSDVSITLFADLGYEVLDNAFVETAAYTITHQSISHELVRCFALFNIPDKTTALLSAARGGAGLLLSHKQILALPGTPFAYWVTNRARSTFARLNTLADSNVTVAVGLITGDNDRFLRLAWEIPTASKRWIRYPKGGGYSKYHADIPLLVDWQDEGEAIKSNTAKKHGSASRFVQNAALYFRDGLTFPNVSLKGFSIRVLPAGCIFSHVSQGVFVSNTDPWVLLGVLSSSVAEYLLRMMSPGRKWHSGFLKSLPFPHLSPDQTESIVAAARKCYAEALQRDSLHETATHFVCPSPPSEDHGIREWSSRAQRLCDYSCSVQQSNQKAIDSICLDAYALKLEDIQSLDSTLSEDTDRPDDDDTDDEEFVREGIEAHVQHWLSYCVGCFVGRWDIRYCMGVRAIPDQPDPFASLPDSSPGMLNDSEETLTQQAYPLAADRDGIIPDDPDHTDDIVRRVREVLELIWKDRADVIEKEACEILGAKGLRDYFRKPGKGGFWDDHVSRYSKSRRKAPIYWLLQSSKKNYGLWLYYHRLDKDMLFKARQNYVDPKIRLEQTRLDSLRSQKTALGADAKSSKKIDKDIERQEILLGELKDFADKLERAAKLNFGKQENLDSDVKYDPDLNDGVVLNIAPLWELVPWKEAKNYWEELLEGKYEWSSMSKLLRKKGLVSTDTTAAKQGGLA